MSIDGEDHFFCCSDCAAAYQQKLETPTAGVLRQHVRRGQTVADIGCGSGHYSFLLADLVGPHGTVYAVDDNPTRVGELREALGKRHPTGGVRLLTASADRLDAIPAQSVDFVLSNNVLCCSDRRSEAAREINRILRPDGIAYLRVSKVLTKGARPMAGPEWDTLLSSFMILGRGEDRGYRWAVVRPKPPLLPGSPRPG